MSTISAWSASTRANRICPGEAYIRTAIGPRLLVGGGRCAGPCGGARARERLAVKVSVVQAGAETIAATGAEVALGRKRTG